ncbi:pro-epidermal growth factor isoform X3 [Synchiropus splendidus]|uniref:pro-epidermal growth factor isoform X3 n=1 Tax=Synchiropus splendidus TaxID=270530 RepID=UPI00237E5DEA|nr:pro-epidermal growth factor isoform X3 [Synchiropus splendidus]
MLLTTAAALVFFMVQNYPPGSAATTCWDELPSGGERNISCVESRPFLLFGHGKAIFRMEIDGKNPRRLVARVGTSIQLDFHFAEKSVYWADKHGGVIYKASAGRRRQKVFSSDKHISGLAVDWLRNTVYWTSEEKGRIKRVDTNGKNERTILRHLTRPTSIVIDANRSFLFWLSGGLSASIQRTDLNGQKRIILKKMAAELKTLSIDREDQRLFWVQVDLRGQGSIASSDYSGRALLITDHLPRSLSLALSIFQDKLYYTDGESKVIKQVNKYIGGEPEEVNVKRLAKSPVAIKVVHSSKQPAADSPTLRGCDEQSGTCVAVCSGLAETGVCRCSEGFALNKQGTHCEDVNECAQWNHGCSLGCENVPGSYFCTCPQGYGLLPDKKSCREIIPCEGNTSHCGSGCMETDEGVVCVCPEGSVLTEDGQSCTGCASADRGGCSQVCASLAPDRWQCGCLPGYQLHTDGKRCVAATGPPPYLLVAHLLGIQRVNPDGTGDQSVVEESRGAVVAVDYDPVQKHVYFASASQRRIERADMDGGSRVQLISEDLLSPGGLTVDWLHRSIYWTDQGLSTVDCCHLDGLKRQTIVSTGLEKPTDIAVHPTAKKLFWTDTGAQPMVESASLEGKDRSIIANTNLVFPTGLTIDYTEDRLIWCDERRAAVETSALDGSDRRVLLENQVGRPFDLAVFEDRLWISDRQHQQLRTFHKRSGKELQRIHGNLVQPSRVVVVQPLAKPEADVCLHQNGGCSQLCQSKLGSAHCSCLPSYILSEDGKSCLPAVTSNETTLSVDREIRPEVTEPNWDVRPTVFTEKMLSALPNLWVSTRSPSVTNSSHLNRSSVERCPSSHESYCLYQGICYYYPEVDSYACNCLSGYMGERCQFNDLEWWDLQQSEQQKRRTMVIAASMMVFLFLLTIIAFLAFCYRARRLHKQPSSDNVSETSVTEEDMSAAIATSVHQLVSENGMETRMVPGSPKRPVCPSCSSETGHNPFSERFATSEHNLGCKCSMVRAAALETTLSNDLHASQSSSFTACSSFKP